MGDGQVRRDGSEVIMLEVKSDTVGEAVKALFEVQSSLTGVRKDGFNSHFKSNYPTIESVMDTLRPVAQEHGLLIVQSTQKDAVRTLIVHVESGEFVGCDTPIVNTKGDAQGMGSGITYARRYALMSLFALAPEDDDGNAASSPRVKSELESMTDMLRETLRSKCKCTDHIEANAVVKLVSGGEHQTFGDVTASISTAREFFRALNHTGQQSGWENLKAMNLEVAT